MQGEEWWGGMGMKMGWCGDESTWGMDGVEIRLKMKSN